MREQCTGSGGYARNLRSAFGCFMTGVTVVTAQEVAANRIGVTINSFCSVSLEPPILSFALGRHAHCLPRFLDSDRFTVHVLSERQHELALRFARPGSATWQGVATRRHAQGGLVIEGCAAWFRCGLASTHEVGDHILLFGRIEQFAWDPAAEPLLFRQGRLARSERLEDLEAAPALELQLSWG